MADRPILFSAPMVRALLDGRKTQTRRVLKAQPEFDATGCTNANMGGRNDWWDYWGGGSLRFRAPFAVGDRIWVKETWRAGASWDDQKPSLIQPRVPVDYVATSREGGPAGKTRVSIFMPRWASRLTLTVTDVRVERLNDCSEEDAIAEGVAEYPCEGPFRGPDATYWTAERGHPEHGARTTPVSAYRALWETINGEGSWEANPWVVAVTFTVEQRNIDA